MSDTDKVKIIEYIVVDALEYFAFQGDGYLEQDHIKTDESYGEVKRKIWR